MGFRPHTAILRISISATNPETYRMDLPFLISVHRPGSPLFSDLGEEDLHILHTPA
jgi:hypothetical protein